MGDAAVEDEDAGHWEPRRGDRRDDDEQAGDPDPADPDPTGRSFVLVRR